MKTNLCFFTIFCSLVSCFSQAQIVSPSGEEVEYTYETEFITNPTIDYSVKAKEHAKHLFGLFKADEFVSSMGLDPYLVAGIGAPRDQMKIEILEVSALEDSEKMKIHYRNSGKMILHQSVANRLFLKEMKLIVPLPYDLEKIYDVNCTDPHYPEVGDYWYFFNMFQSQCKHLHEMPYSQKVEIKTRPYFPKKEITPKLPQLRRNNGNGSKLSVYIIHGYAESSKDPHDDGRRGFKMLNEYLKEQGFKEKLKVKHFNRPLNIYTKKLNLADGYSVDVEVKHILVETDLESKTITFAKFFKQSAEEADVIIYNGHSGLGANLDIPGLEKKAGEFKFKNKRQIFFFDSCSSYSYYLQPFVKEKRKGNIDVIQNGLASYFHTGHLITIKFLEVLLDEKDLDPSWLEILQKMQEPLEEGGSYLLNVGGV